MTVQPPQWMEKQSQQQIANVTGHPFCARRAIGRLVGHKYAYALVIRAYTARIYTRQSYPKTLTKNQLASTSPSTTTDQQNSGRANHFNLPALRFHRGVPDALHDFFSATAVAVSDPVFWHHSSGVVHQVQYHRVRQGAILRPVGLRPVCSAT